MFDLMTWSFVNETGRLARTASQLTCWPGGTDADCLSTDLGASALIAPFRIDLDLDLSVADGGYAYPLSLSSLPAWSDWSPDWASLSTAYPLIYVYFEGASLRLEAYRTGVGACGFWSDNVFVAGAPNYLRLEAAVTWDAGLSRWVMAFTVKTFSDAERTAGTTVGMLTVGFPDADARALRYLSLGSTYLDAATLTIAHVSFGPAGSNMAPEVDAGADQTITARTRGIAVASLEGTASDDGQPVPPGALTTTWSQVSGPGTATLTNAASRWTRVSFDVVGDYVLRLTATDGELEAHDDVTITVENTAPAVEAGPAQTTHLGALALLVGRASDDGWPSPPGALTYAWSQVSGPGTATLTNAASRWTRVSFDVVGDYVLRLTATDGELEAHDDVTLTVGPVPPEHAFDPDDDPTGRVHPLLWIEHTRKTGDRRASAMLPLADPSSYYLGWKEPEVLQYGAFHRATSDATGRYETAQITWQVADRDRFWRILAADPAQVDFLNDPVVARAIPDARRRARDLARTVARGFIQRSTPGPTLTYDFVAADWFARLLTVEIPRRRLSRVHFPNLPADADGAGEPVCYGAQSDEGSQFGPVTGLTAAIEAFGSPVTTVALGASGTGGTLGGGLTYGLRVSARGDDDREYDLSDGATATTPTATSQLPRDHAIPPPTGVVCYTTHYFTGSHLPSGFFTKRRYVRMTAIKEVDGVLKESPPSNWTAIEGDLQADSAATIMGRFDPSVTKGRAYFFNLSDFGPIGWDPLLDPNPPIGVEGDTVPLVQYVEVTLAALPDLCPFTAEDQALGWPAGGYDTLESSPAFGKHWIRVVRDTDGTNFVLDAIAASVAGTWDAWAPPAGVALVGYNAYLDLPNGTTRVLELDAGTTAHTFTAEDEGARISGRTYTYAAAAQCSDGQTALSAPVTITTPPKQQLAPILLTCGVLAEALDYRFYRREPGGAYNRRWLVVASSAPSLTDDFTDTGATLIAGIPQPVGVVPCRHVGTLEVDGVVRQAFLVAAHACRAVLSVFSGGVRVSPTRYGLDWWVPGQVGEPLYRDLSGRRYTLVCTTGAWADDAISGDRPITANVRGAETIGDGTGDLIESLPLQLQHWLENFGLGDYQTGAWLAAPTFPADPPPEAGPALSVLDAASFAAAHAQTLVRLEAGYPGATLLGAGGEILPLGDVLARWLVSGDLELGMNRRMQISVWMEPVSSEAPGATEFSQALHILADRFTPEHRETELFNAGPYAYGFKPIDGSWAFKGTWPAEPDPGALGEIRTAPEAQLYMVALQAVAEDVIARRVRRSALLPHYASLTVPLAGLSTELGDVIRATHLDGVGDGAPGWVKRPTRIRAADLDPENWTVTLTVRDLRHLPASDPS